MKNRGLGRGLDALLSNDGDNVSSKIEPTNVMPLSQLTPGKFQPRKNFNQDSLKELAESIKAQGIIQPILVRMTSNNKYEIIAGERRWQAAKIEKLDEVPVVVKDISDSTALAMALIENIQRADLNPVEEAAGYRQLMDRFGHTQEKLAEALGKSRSHIANLLRLLNLPTDVQGYLVSGQLSTGHARALITSDHPSELAKKIIAGNLSVRETERLVKQAAQGTDEGKKAKTPGSKHKLEKDADTKALEGDLSAALGMRVSVEHKMGTEAGSITITYKTLDQLDDLCGLLSATNLDGSK